MTEICEGPKKEKKKKILTDLREQGYIFVSIWIVSQHLLNSFASFTTTFRDDEKLLGSASQVELIIMY